MKHVKNLTRTPAQAADIPVNVKIQFLVAILNAVSPVLVAKDPNAATTA